MSTVHTSRTEMNFFTARFISSIAATTISLACGTNYVYSAWGPQFADKLKFSSTEQNLVGLSANFGMYSLGIPIGIFVDANGARITVLYGSALLGIGYFALYNAYSFGSGYLPLLCLASFFTGVGGCASFAAAVKVSALNWPHARGSATAFPVAAFGLSAFFFSSFGQLLVAGDTSDFLLLLAIGTFGLNFIGFFFLKIVQPPEVVDSTATVEFLVGRRLHSTKSDNLESEDHLELVNEDPRTASTATEESTFLITKASSVRSGHNYESLSSNCAQPLQVRGLKLITHIEFWQLFSLMGILAGIALMTINNIGNNVKALWRQWDETKDEISIIKHESLQVSIISIASFLGRIVSGIGSDFLVKVLKASRLWCLVFASVVFFVAQLFALTISDPRLLFLVSAPTGLAYGFLFGCFPSLVSEAFGIRSLSQNWGAMTLSPIISGNTLNLFYGTIYDHQSIVGPNGNQICNEGILCYRKAYYLTSLACITGLIVSLWSIFYTHRSRQDKCKQINSDESDRVV